MKTLEEGQQELKDDVGVLKIEIQGARADILQIRESQADLRDRLIEHGQHLEAIRTQQDAHTATFGDLLNFAKSHDVLLKNTATKDDVAAIKATQDLILQLLQKRGE